MKTVIDWVVLVVAIGCFVSLFGIKISFKPFKITADSWMYGLGWALLIVAISLIVLDRSKKEYRKGFEEGVDTTVNHVNKLLDEAVDRAKERKDKETTVTL